MAAALVAYKNTNLEELYKTSLQFTFRFNAISNGAKLDPLANSESGYEIAYEVEYRTNYVWSVPYYAENILWINMDNPNCNWYFFLGSGLNAIIHILTKMAVLAATGTIPTIGAVIFLYALTIWSTTFHRIRGDCKFGISGQLLPIPANTLWFDYGNDGYGQNNMYGVPIPGLAGVTLFYALNLGSPHWTPIVP